MVASCQSEGTRLGARVEALASDEGRVTVGRGIRDGRRAAPAAALANPKQLDGVLMSPAFRTTREARSRTESGNRQRIAKRVRRATISTAGQLLADEPARHSDSSDDRCRARSARVDRDPVAWSTRCPPHRVRGDRSPSSPRWVMALKPTFRALRATATRPPR
jgi:hypothetical protein